MTELTDVIHRNSFLYFIDENIDAYFIDENIFHRGKYMYISYMKIEQLKKVLSTLMMFNETVRFLQ